MQRLLGSRDGFWWSLWAQAVVVVDEHDHGILKEELGLISRLKNTPVLAASRCPGVPRWK